MSSGVVYQFIRDHIQIILLAVLNIILLANLIYIRRTRKKRDFIYEISAKDQRMAELDHRIANPEFLARTGTDTVKRYPYETVFLSNTEKGRDLGNMYVGILVETELMRQKYFTDTNTPIEVGSSEKCSVTVQDDKMGERHFVLYADNGQVYVRSLSEHHTTILERGQDYLRLSEVPVVIEDNDQIQAGAARFTITFGK